VQIDDIVGQKRIVDFIKSQSEKNQFSHAYLFAGQFGSGKTSIARILASLMVCSERDGHNVCEKCRSCVAIRAGYCSDVIEISAASKRGIDDARKIIETASYAPQEFKRKVYILDEVHMLTTEAWNALLKIIEEPPPYVSFIFCTTDHRKVPETILSRCQRFVFNQISLQDIVLQLKKICIKENIDIDDEALCNISKISKGSLRDAICHLEQIYISKGSKINGKVSEEYFGTINDTIIYNIVDLIINQDASGVLEKVNVLLQLGINAKTILIDISSLLRNIFICKICGENSKLMDVLDVEREKIRNMSEKVERNGLIRVSSSLSRIEKEININLNERWVLEAALINCLTILNTK